MTVAARIPDCVEELTPDWLSQVVSERFPGAEAAAVEVVDAHSGTTGRARLRVQWSRGSAAPEALFVKLAPTDPEQRDWVVSEGMGRRESRFYAEIARDVPVRIPEPIWAGSTDDGSHYLMLLEDLLAGGCTPHSWGSDSYDVEAHAQGMMETLGRLHAHFWDTPRFDADMGWVDPPRRSEVGPMLMKEALSQFGARMPDAFRDLAHLYIEHTDALNDLLEAGPPTLAHGDCHLGNTFTDAGTVGLLDWALVCRAQAFRDVGYYLCSSLPTETRREQTELLLERYLAALVEAGGPRIDLESAHEQLELHAVTSWVAATVTAASGDRMQTLEAGLLGMDRATTAIVELDTPQRLREALGL